SIALGRALTPHDLQIAADAGDTILDAAAVGFQLRFPFTATHADAAFLTGQVAPKAGEPREQMLQLGQLDLQLPLAGAGALGENVQDKRGAVQNLAIEDALQISALGGR